MNTVSAKPDDFWRWPTSEGEPSIYLLTYECGTIRTLSREAVNHSRYLEDFHQHEPQTVLPSTSEHQARWYQVPCGHEVMSTARPTEILAQGVFCYLCYDASKKKGETA